MKISSMWLNLICIGTCISFGFATPSHAQTLSPLQVYDRAAQLATERFYDRSFRGLDWPALVARYRTEVTEASSSHQVASSINALLGNLCASHTEFVTTDEQEYQRAALIGTTTAGHFLGGAYHKIVDGQSSLYLAEVGDPTGVIEGVGIAPDFKVLSPLPYSHGRDVQLEAVVAKIRSALSDDFDF